MINSAPALNLLEIHLGGPAERNVELRTRQFIDNQHNDVIAVSAVVGIAGLFPRHAVLADIQSRGSCDRVPRPSNARC
jgi:hypothetical protein